jgi:hypothetical protein
MTRLKEHPDAVLLVEGNDDFHVLHNICNGMDVCVRNLDNQDGGNFSIFDCSGIDSLLEQIPVRLKGRFGKYSLGVILDADVEIEDRWKSLKNICQTQGFNVPETMPLEGLIMTKDNISLGVWIMPNNKFNGNLEDFMRMLIPTDDKLLPLSNELLDKIEEQSLNKYFKKDKSKVLIHNWLSLQEQPGSPLGQGIAKRYFQINAEICDTLVKWLKNLYG